jgi:prepilin-type processing-associated H-X9-DG protein
MEFIPFHVSHPSVMSADQQHPSPGTAQTDSACAPAPTRRFRYSLRGLLLFVGIISVALGVGRRFLVVMPAEKRETFCRTHLTWIGSALLAYRGDPRFLDPSFPDEQGKPQFSWRVRISFHHTSPVAEWDKPWDSPKNAYRLARFAEYDHPYHCPDDDSPPQMTSYVAIVGPHTAWRPHAAWPTGKGLQLADFKNPSKTIVIVELHNSGINFAEPRDLDISELAKVTANCHSGGFHALFADGHVELLPADIDLKKLAAMCDPNGE